MSALQRFGKEYSAISRRLGVHCSRYTDLILAGGVVLIIAMLIYPMPQCVMDVMIGVNISVAALMLLVALYVPDATRLPSFPTILLLTTLFRLAINVSTTRLILSEADAGEIIRAFGEFVVQGNYVVGAVRLPRSRTDPIHCHRQRIGAGRRGFSAFHARRRARQADEHRR